MAALIQCGELCRSCGVECGRDYADGAVLIECPVCCGDGCEHCKGGQFAIDKCPREMLGQDFMRAVNYASISGSGDWPIAGGLMDQSAWFVDLYMRLKSEINRIERQRSEDAKRR